MFCSLLQRFPWQMKSAATQLSFPSSMQTFGVGMLDFYRSDESKCILLCILLLVQILLCANSAYSVFTGSNILLDTARLSVQHIFFPFFFGRKHCIFFTFTASSYNIKLVLFSFVIDKYQHSGFPNYRY